MTGTPSGKSRLTTERLLLAAVLLVALAVRAGVLFALRANLADDPDAYRQIAESLLQHGVFAMGHSDHPQPTAYRPPLYPILLSNLAAAEGHTVSLAKVAVLHVLLGVATVWLTWLIARRVSPPLPHGARELLLPATAAIVVACDPILLNQQSLVMTETLATFLSALSLWCLARFTYCRSWFWAGLSGGAIGLAILCRPTFLPWLALVGAVMLVVKCRMQKPECRTRPDSWQFSGEIGRRLGNAAALVAIAALVVSPWVIRNQRVFGKPIATTTHGGYTLYLANNDEFYAWLGTDKSGVPWNSGNFDLRWQVAQALSDWGPSEYRELFSDPEAYKLAQETIRSNPAMFVRAGLYRIGQLWSPLPNKLTAEESLNRRLLRYATCAWYCGVYVLAAVGLWRLRGKLVQPPWLWGVLLCLTFTAVHTFYWTNLRMRAPLVPFVALVATAALVRRAGRPPHN